MHSATSHTQQEVHTAVQQEVPTSDSPVVTPPTPIDAVPINDHSVGSTPSLVETKVSLWSTNPPSTETRPLTVNRSCSKMLIETQLGLLSNVACSCYKFITNFFCLFVVAVVVQKHVKALKVSFKKGMMEGLLYLVSSVGREDVCLC